MSGDEIDRQVSIDADIGMETKDGQRKQPPLRDAFFKGAASLAAGALIAVVKIQKYAQATFSQLGMFKDLQSRLASKLKSTSDTEIAKALEKSYFDIDLGWRAGGVFENLQKEYAKEVKTVFREQGAGSLVDKWRTVLTAEQKTKTLLFAAGTAVAVGAFIFHRTKRPHTAANATDLHADAEPILPENRGRSLR
ncbi:hypothetical protein [Aeoliella sp.]|uniref:hypothetical protein n=1 Tax=Aeoliella sp. TaxID=2795800 RepID=UPI003CCB8661